MIYISKMADGSGGDFDRALSESVELLSSKLGYKIRLKHEQKVAIEGLISGVDVLAVLPTGFGKSIIFQLLVTVKEKLSGHRSHVLVICPLISIVTDQISEAKSIGLTANCIREASLEDIEAGKYQLVFGSAEDVLDKGFLSSLKKDTSFRSDLAAVIVDECHTVETWSGKRGAKRINSSTNSAFRVAFGKLSVLRSYFNEGTPVAALTGTADKAAQSTIKNKLCLCSNVLSVYVSPNRENLRFFVKKVKKDYLLNQMLWLVDLIIEQGINCPKTIIFCNTITEIAHVVNFLMMKLGDNAYHGKDPKNPESCLIGIYHSNSWQSSKDRLTKSFKENGMKRIAIATTSLSMGVNFPDIRYIINYGPARTIFDQYQEAGRAGRDGLPAHVIIFYHGQQLAHCEDEVKEFVKSTGCLRVAAYKSFDHSIKPLQPLHSCCSNCILICQCNGNSCNVGCQPFENENEESLSSSTSGLTRPVSLEDRQDLKSALLEVLEDESMSLDQTYALGFSVQLVEDIVQKCSTIFTLKDITDNFPVYSIKHTKKILEVVQEIFLDIPNFEQTISLLDANLQYEPVIYNQDLDDFDFDNCTGNDSDK